jgi:hypothetical protein
MKTEELEKLLAETWHSSKNTKEQSDLVLTKLASCSDADLMDYTRMFSERCDLLKTPEILSAYWCLHHGEFFGEMYFLDFTSICAAAPCEILSDLIHNPDSADQYMPRIETTEQGLFSIAGVKILGQRGHEIAGVYSIREGLLLQDIKYLDAAGHDVLRHAKELTPRLWKKFIQPKIRKWPEDFELDLD